MSDYKQYRADFAKLAWVAALTTTHDSKSAAQKAVSWADDFIAELERTEAEQPCSKYVVEYNGEKYWAPLIKKPEPPQPEPALPRLNTGWKWAPGDGTHKITPFDVWRENDGRLSRATTIGMPCNLENCLATPDWYNPENAADPGDGYRFLVKGEKRGDSSHFMWTDGGWVETPLQKNAEAIIGSGGFTATYRTPATHPLPPVLADEKEVQP